MKKIIAVLIILFSCLFIPVIDSGNKADAKISLVDFTSTKVYESFIKRELKDELGADFDVKLEIYSSKSLKDGIFKNLKLYSDRLFYKGLSISDVYAETVNENNKIVYKNKRVYYPEELPLKFTASIMKEDLDTVIKSELFNSRLEEINDKFGGFVYIDTPAIQIKSGKIYFDVPVKPFFAPKNIIVHFNSDIDVEDNELMLKNISFTSSGNFIDMKLLDSIAAQLNPVRIRKENLQNKFCNILIDSAQINDDIIKLNGNLIIKANYRGKNE